MSRAELPNVFLYLDDPVLNFSFRTEIAMPPRSSRALTPHIRLIAYLLIFVGPHIQTTSAGSAAKLEVEPAQVTLVGSWDRQQVAISGYASDGSVKDLSAEARLTVEPPGLVRISASGVLTPAATGAGIVTVEAAGLSTRFPVRVEQSALVRDVSYRLDVAPLLAKAGCNAGACHGNLNGKGGFKLSLRGDDPLFDHSSITHDASARRASLADPRSSLIYKKPTGEIPHEGGLRFTRHSPEAFTLIAWLSKGAKDDAATAPTLTRLEVFPVERYLPAPGLTQQLVVTATFSDGKRRDVTRQSSYDVSDPTRVSISEDGRAQAKAPTETAIAVRYLGGRAVSRLAFLADRPNFVWRGPPSNLAIDRHVFAKLQSLKINPSDTANDAVFLRRAHLDAIGKLPTAPEARAFLSNTDPDKRLKLARKLVNRPEFADFWALKWADLLRNEEKSMGEKGVWVFQRWLRDAFAADLPLDEFVRRLITAQGSTWSNPPASFYRTNRDPQTLAESVGQVFLGVRLQCARCHNHPFDSWTQNDYYGLAAYFGNVRRKEVANARKDNLDKHEINGDVIVYLSGAPGAIQPRSGAMMAPKPPGAPPPAPALNEHADAREDLARWLTQGNRQFARNMANRVWFHLLGRGIVDPVDDFRESNPPCNPPLLESLTDALINGGYRLRPLVELIMSSQTYQLAATPNETNASDEANFARASVRLLPAEVLLDALGQALEKPDIFSHAPRTTVASQLPSVQLDSPFLKIFGKPDRLLTCECERSEATTLAQAFQLINGEAVRSKIEAPDNRLGRLLASAATDEAVLEDLTLASLSRLPAESEKSEFLRFLRSANDRRRAWEDVAWAIVNSKEFLLRH